MATTAKPGEKPPRSSQYSRVRAACFCRKSVFSNNSAIEGLLGTIEFKCRRDPSPDDRVLNTFYDICHGRRDIELRRIQSGRPRLFQTTERSIRCKRYTE